MIKFHLSFWIITGEKAGEHDKIFKSIDNFFHGFISSWWYFYVRFRSVNFHKLFHRGVSVVVPIFCTNYILPKEASTKYKDNTHWDFYMMKGFNLFWGNGIFSDSTIKSCRQVKFFYLKKILWWYDDGLGISNFHLPSSPSVFADELFEEELSPDLNTLRAALRQRSIAISYYSIISFT